MEMTSTPIACFASQNVTFRCWENLKIDLGAEKLMKLSTNEAQILFCLVELACVRLSCDYDVFNFDCRRFLFSPRKIKCTPQNSPNTFDIVLLSLLSPYLALALQEPNPVFGLEGC